MANNYDKILELANANNMGLSNTIKRDFGIPLDYTSVQASYEAALTYAATNTLAYVGQPISVGDKLYIVTAESQGKYPAEVEEGGSQIDVFLAEVGSATEGDGSTIDLKDGVLSLHGIDGKTSGTYVPSLVDGVLVWNAPDNTTVDGLTASVDALNLKVFGKAADEEVGTEKVDGLVDIVADQADLIAANTKAIEDEKAARETAVSGEATARGEAIKAVTDSIGAVTEGKTVVEMIADAEAAAKAAIPTNNASLTNGAGYQTASDVSSAISTAIAGKADASSVYTKTEVDGFVTGLENTIAGITHFTTKVVSSTDDVTEIGVLYLIKDENVSGTDKYNEYLFIEGLGAVLIGDTTTDLSDYVTNDALATELAKYTTTEGLATVLAPYATKDQVNAKLDAGNWTINNSTLSTGDTDDSIALDNTGITIKSEDDATETSYSSYGVYTHDRGRYLKTHYIPGSIINNDKEIHLPEASGTFALTSDVDGALQAVKEHEEAVNAELAKKVETAQLRHTSEGVGEGVTKDGTALTITVDAYRKSEVYTKSETDNQIDAKIASVTGGESAADVKIALESYRDAINAEMWGADAANWTTRTTGEDGKVTVTYTPQYGTTSRVDTLEADFATLKTNVEKAQTDATNAGNAVSTLESTKVANNTSRIDAIEAQITNESGLSARIGALEAADIEHKTEYANLKAKVDAAVDTTIPALNNRISNNESAIVTINNTLNGVEGGSEGLVATVAKKANAADVYTKGEVDAKVITSGEVVHGTTDSVSIADNKITVTVNSYTKSEVDTAISTAIGNIDNTAITNNSADIAVLVGNDKGEDGRANKSIRAIAADEINTLIKAADPEGGKTIENINNLITYVDENAGEIAELITATDANTDKLADITSTVGATIDAKIEAAKYVLEVATAEKLGGVKSASGDNKVSVAADGVMSVATVNVNTLTQTAGDLLILNGGTASI